jgi:hypothetical protein
MRATVRDSSRTSEARCVGSRQRLALFKSTVYAGASRNFAGIRRTVGDKETIHTARATCNGRRGVDAGPVVAIAGAVAGRDGRSGAAQTESVHVGAWVGVRGNGRGTVTVSRAQRLALPPFPIITVATLGGACIAGLQERTGET